MSNLKPCPFCGSDVILAARGDECEHLYCDGCGAAGPDAAWEPGRAAKDYPWATEAWNRRTSSPMEETP